MSGFYDDASWLLIPEGIEEDIVFAQKPTNGTGDLTFTRASDATRTNSAGVIERTPWNLLTFSEMFSDVAWTKGNSTIGVNTATAPNGTLTADSLIGNGVSNNHSTTQSVSLVTGVTYTLSFYAKANTNNFIQITSASGAFGVTFFANFNLSNGTVGSVGAAALSPSIQSVGDGWYRCSVSAVSLTTSSAVAFALYLVTSGTSVRLETNTLSTSVFIWGAQLVEGTDAKPYFATTNRQDVPRLDYRNADGTLNSCPRLLLEPQRTNSIRNSTMVGAVAGSPGTTPTNWVINAAGLTQTIVGLGTENGLQYIDFRFNGTATGAQLLVSSEGTAQIVASNGQTWTNSFYFKSIAAPTPPNSYNLFTIQRVSGTSGGAFTQAFTPTTTLSRYSQTVTTTNASTTHIQPYFLGSLTIGATYDFTIRIAAPQMELGAYATTFIPTTTAAVTRLADAASKTGVSSLIGQTEGTLFVEVDLTLGRNNTSSGNGILDVLDSTRANAVTILKSATVNQILFALRVNSVNTFITGGAYISGTNKIAVAYKSGQTACYVNGILVNTSSLSFTFSASIDAVNVGAYTTNVIDDRISQAAIFKTRLTNAQLAQLTTL